MASQVLGKGLDTMLIDSGIPISKVSTSSVVPVALKLGTCVIAINLEGNRPIRLDATHKSPFRQPGRKHR